jgi:hypothetical protein
MASVARTGLGALLIAGVLVTGCSSNPPPASKPVAGRPATVSAAPEISSAYAPRRQAVVDIENPDGIVAAAGMVFVKTDDGRVVRVDPATNKVTGSVRVDTSTDPQTYCQGIGADSAAVWACAAADDGTGLAQIDPKTLRVTRRVAVRKVFDQLTLPVTARGVWVLDGDGSSLDLVGSDGTTMPYALGVRGLQVAALGDRVVVTAATSDTVLFVDAGTGKVAARVMVHEPRIAAVAGSDVWVDSADGLTRLRGDGTVVSVYPSLSVGLDGDIATAGGVILLRAGDGTINRIDATGGRLLERITPDTPLRGGSMIVAYGSLWLTSGDDGTLTRLRLTA